MKNDIPTDRKILISIDESGTSQRALQYVGRFIGNTPGFDITVLHIIEDPPEDHFPNEEARKKYFDEKDIISKNLLKNAQEMLHSKGVPLESIHTRGEIRAYGSLGISILEEQKKGGFGTLVVGRRDRSKQEEILLGSVSRKIIQTAKNCSIWVVE
jgi:nucleotide-binding universal stress UspA family protein